MLIRSSRRRFLGVHSLCSDCLDLFGFGLFEVCGLAEVFLLSIPLSFGAQDGWAFAEEAAPGVFTSGLFLQSAGGLGLAAESFFLLLLCLFKFL